MAEKLNQMNVRQSERLAAESQAEREARLQSTRDHVAAESTEERETRLELLSERQRERGGTATV